MQLRDIDLQKIYDSERDNILNDFYNPALECAVRYDRITGFFSPKVFALAARGFRKCIENHCKIRIITSIELEPEIYDGLTEKEKDSAIKGAIDAFDPDAIFDDLQLNYLKLFLYLYETGQLELKIAIVEKNKGIMHEKIGVIYDRVGDAIAFSGSNNETASGWANNIEEFLVFNSWEESSSDYFNDRIGKFNNYWTGNTKKFKVASINDIEKERLVRKINNEEFTKEELIERIKTLEGGNGSGEITPPEKKPRELRQYQKDAINHWLEYDYKSIFSMATGTGKTFTALNALKSFRDKEEYLHCVIAVPLISLVQQWEDEIRHFFPDLKTICACSKVNPNWKEEVNALGVNALFGNTPDFVIITTYNTFASDFFSETVSSLSNRIVLVADEMHNLVVENKKRIKAVDVDYYKYRLGLSATPTKLWNPDDSEYTAKLFGDNAYTYDLEKAIKNNYLVPYYYHPIGVSLTNDEYEEYLRLTKEMARYSYASDSPDGDYSKEKYKTLRLQRADIKKNAENKVLVLSSLLSKIKKEDQLKQALIYVDDNDSLFKVQMALTELSIKTAKFTGEEDLKTRDSVVKGLRNGQHDAIIAIKCLDEGVDIPSAKMAFITSSSTEPREYVQRLGRVLRLDKDSNKTFSSVYDFIVTPPKGIIFESETERNTARNLIKNELIRAKFFISLSKDAEAAQSAVDDIADEFSFNYTDDELDYNNRKENTL